MRELSLQIGVEILHQKSEPKNIVLMANDYYQLQNLHTSNAAGLLIDCNQSIIIDKPDEKICKEFVYSRRCIVKFEDSTGKKYFLGTQEFPALVTIVPDLNVARLNIKCKMLKSPFI